MQQIARKKVVDYLAAAWKRLPLELGKMPGVNWRSLLIKVS
jgi:hypothetical protein